MMHECSANLYRIKYNRKLESKRKEAEDMKTCPKCGKVNQPTRKYCIRCGASLRKPPSRKRATTKAKPEPEPEPAIVGTSPPPPVTDDEWVRPSQIRKDRVRTTSKKKGTSEMDKARRTFEEAEHSDSRMLRASEVHELIEGPGEMGTDEAAGSAGPESIPAPIETPKPEEIEEQLLGSQSAIVRGDEAAAEVSSAPAPSTGMSGEFRSSKYGDAEEVAEVEEATPAPTEELEYEEPPAAEEAEVTTAKPETTEQPASAPAAPVEDLLDRPTLCPRCGAILTIDGFDYPPEIYSAMAQARIKQARFFVVQSKYSEAIEIIRIARALFAKASDPEGIKEVDKLAKSIASRA